MQNPLAFSPRRAAAVPAMSAVAALATWASTSTSAWAQSNDIRFQCDYEFASAAAPLPASVPSMSLLGVALLVALVALAAWRLGRFPGARLMSAVLVAAAVLLANQGGGGLVQKAYAAALGLTFTNPAGESLADKALYGSQVTLTNGTNVPLLLTRVYTSSWPQSAMGSCAEGTNLAPGASCTGALSCGGFCGPMEEFSTASPTGCACEPGTARNYTVGLCVDVKDCGSTTWNGWEYECLP